MSNNYFSIRLQKALDLNKMRPIELAAKTGIDKSSISSYLSGRYKANDDNLHSIAKALDVSEAWLLGYDVSIDGKNTVEPFDELDILFSKYKDILTDDDKEYIKFIIEKRKKEIDKQLGEEN